MIWRTLMLSLIALAPAVGLCADPPPQGVWTGKGQAGFVASQGNTNARTGNAAFDLGLLDGPWQHALHLEGLYARSADVTSAERWDAGWQTNYTFSPALYAFGALRYDHDLFSGFDYQASAAAGIGYKIIDLASTKLSVQVGPGFREEEPELIFKNAAGVVIGRVFEGSTGSAIVSAGLDYSQALTATATLSDKLLLESGGGNTLYTNALALTVKMSTRLALSLGYNLQANSAPPPGLKKLDTIETVNLVFSF
jgi:putative salt-induced outer membrane protein